MTEASTSLLGDLDVDTYLSRVPHDAMCKGMYFGDLLAILRKSRGELGPLVADLAGRRYVPFRDYPLRDHMIMTAAVSRALFPEVSTRESMRRLGWKAFPTFEQSLIGRIIFRTLGPDLDDVFSAGPKSLEISLTRGRAKAIRLGPSHWRYEFTDVFGYLDTYYLGVVEGPIRQYGSVPEVHVETSTLSDGVMDITWR